MDPMLAFYDVSEILIWVTATVLVCSFVVPMVLATPHVRGAEHLVDGLAVRELRGRLLRVSLHPRELRAFLVGGEDALSWARAHPDQLGALLAGPLPLHRAEAWPVWEQLGLEAREWITLWHKLRLARELSAAGEGPAFYPARNLRLYEADAERLQPLLEELESRASEGAPEA